MESKQKSKAKPIKPERGKPGFTSKRLWVPNILERKIDIHRMKLCLEQSKDVSFEDALLNLVEEATKTIELKGEWATNNKEKELV